MGIPARRYRAYGNFGLLPIAKRDPKATGLFETFARRFVVDSSIYFTTPEEEQRQEIMQRIARARSQAVRDREVEVVMETVEEEDSFTPEGLRRLEDYAVKASRLGLIDEHGKWSPNVNVALVNMRQEEGKKGSIDVKVMPSLLQSSHVYDLRAGRTLSLKDSWQVQGYNVANLDGVPEFPFPQVLDPASFWYASVTQQRSMLGNSMNMQQVGTWILYNLASTTVEGDIRPD